ncbi:MAG: hypothetical protein DHS20C15_11600 [Planctomycetota bacterium]|nr:MAG: hypothetical protein DHS20C15_11600 [Planctomycetota bacterium]
MAVLRDRLMLLSGTLLTLAALSVALEAAPTSTPPADETAAPIASGNAAAIDAILHEGTHNSQVMNTLRALTEIGPRQSGSAGLDDATAWAAARFEELGLTVELQPWGELAYGFERGPSHVRVVGEDSELSFMTRAWTAGTPGAVQAPALLAPVSEAGFEGIDWAGAWVLTPRSDQDARLADLSDEERAARRDFLRARNERLRELGVAGLISRSGSGELLRMSGDRGLMMEGAAVLPTHVSVTLTGAHFDALVERLLAGEALALDVDIDNRFIEGPVEQVNVVAELRGSERPEEVVIVGGHIDTWDIALGVNDNGTGVSTTLEAARLLVTSGAQPRRTIRFVLWSGEEQGLYGSRGQVEQLSADELARVSAVLVHDGGTNALTGLNITSAMEPQLRTALAPLMSWVEEHAPERGFELNVVSGFSRGGSSDHAPYVSAGVPGFFWRQSGTHTYSDTHHTQIDTLEYALPDDLQHSSMVVALAALGIADAPELVARRGMLRATRRLGVFMADDAKTVRNVSGGLAAEHGLLSNDVLLSVDGQPVGNDSEAGEQSVGALRDAGEGRKWIVWQSGSEEKRALFEWDSEGLDRDPQRVELTAADGAPLVGDWYAARTGRPASGSALILLPMARQQRTDWMPARAALEDAGIATFALDPRGHGESRAADGAYRARLDARDTSAYEEATQDVAAAVAFLESKGYPAERIGVMGASIGCSIALRAAVNDPRLAGVAALTPGANYIGFDSMSDLTQWDQRPLLLVSSDEEANAGARPLHAAAQARDPWAPVDLVILPQTGIHGTRMLGVVAGVEQQLAAWWTRVLRKG